MLVDGFNATVRAAVSAYATVFAGWSPFAGLLALSVLIGAGMLWVVAKTSNQRAIGQAKRRMQAHLLEMRVFSDEPRILLRAQRDMLVANAKYVGHMLRPALFLTLPMVILYGHFDSVYGRRPLSVGETALVVAHAALPGSELTLTASDGVDVDSASVTAVAEGRTYWRVRATRPGMAEVQLQTPTGTVTKRVVSGEGASYVSARRSASWWRRLLLDPGETRPEVASIGGLELEYPSRQMGPPGWETHWAIWFLGVSILAAFLLKGRFGVVL